MSLQRIIELARRQGMPVILTDVAGREPMVVLPLEAYEKMLDGEGQGSKGKGQRLEEDQNAKRQAQNLGRDHSRPDERNQRQKESDIQQSVVSEPKPLASDLKPLTSPPQDGLRVRQRDEDRVQALHRSLDTVSHEVPAQQLPQKEGGDGLVLEERFSFQP
ncbi:hypothetical protein KBD61_03970 [Patescibacteria group bacterium]|nr:hypothetical protein [Patescibacteria group bacterium]MBP9710153.1 hypothetical protein [Patescibacteria group bacterium]